MSKNNKILKSIIINVSFPLVMLLIAEICSLTKGTHIITAVTDIQNLIRSTAIACLYAYALSFNLTCGRMDLSLGAQRLIGVIIGGNIGLAIGFNGIGIMIFAFIFGLLFGAFTGVMFVLTRVPAMVLGVGLGLVYECVSYFASEGKGFNIFGVVGSDILINMWFILVIILLLAALLIFLLQYTQYGYHLRAIQGSQRISRASGVNVFINAVLCYTFAGGYASAAGMVDAAMNNGLSIATGFTSNGTVMANMFPMFLGMYLSRWSNQAVGIFVGSLTINIFELALTRLQLNNAQSSVVTMAIFLLFLIFLANENIFKIRKAEKARIKLAQEKKAGMTSAAAV